MSGTIEALIQGTNGLKKGQRHGPSASGIVRGHGDHGPAAGELAARLIGSRTPIEFKKGAICRIDFEVFPPKGPGVLRWFITPKMLRKLA